MRKDRLVGEMLGEETALSPSDLYNTDFKTSVMGGYDKKEVDTFLERVGDVFEALIKQIRELREEIEEQRETINSSREMESTLRNALASAGKFREDTLEAARGEAAAIREQAKVALAHARLQATDLPGQLRQEIAHLKQQRDQLRQDLAAVLRTHFALLQEIVPAETQQGSPVPGPKELEAAEQDLAKLARAEADQNAAEPWLQTRD